MAIPFPIGGLAGAAGAAGGLAGGLAAQLKGLIPPAGGLLPSGMGLAPGIGLPGVAPQASSLNIAAPQAPAPTPASYSLPPHLEGGGGAHGTGGGESFGGSFPTPVAPAAIGTQLAGDTGDSATREPLQGVVNRGTLELGDYLGRDAPIFGGSGGEPIPKSVPINPSDAPWQDMGYGGASPQGYPPQSIQQGTGGASRGNEFSSMPMPPVVQRPSLPIADIFSGGGAGTSDPYGAILPSGMAMPPVTATANAPSPAPSASASAPPGFLDRGTSYTPVPAVTATANAVPQAPSVHAITARDPQNLAIGIPRNPLGSTELDPEGLARSPGFELSGLQQAPRPTPTFDPRFYTPPQTQALNEIHRPYSGPNWLDRGSSHNFDINQPYPGFTPPPNVPVASVAPSDSAQAVPQAPGTVLPSPGGYPKPASGASPSNIPPSGMSISARPQRPGTAVPGGTPAPGFLERGSTALYDPLTSITPPAAPQAFPQARKGDFGGGPSDLVSQDISPEIAALMGPSPVAPSGGFRAPINYLEAGGASKGEFTGNLPRPRPTRDFTPPGASTVPPLNSPAVPARLPRARPAGPGDNPPPLPRARPTTSYTPFTPNLAAVPGINPFTQLASAAPITPGELSNAEVGRPYWDWGSGRIVPPGPPGSQPTRPPGAPNRTSSRRERYYG